MKRALPFAIALMLSVSGACAGTTSSSSDSETLRDESHTDTTLSDEMTEMVSLVLSEMPENDKKVRYDTLTEEDFRIVADELGVEVAAIKAVVKIEAGAKLQGFWAPGVPVANYVQSLYNKYSAKSKGRKIKDAKVPSGLSGNALKEWTSLTNARKTNADAADMGTYWGMFQIGGFNYKLCGCETVEEMVEKICDSEFSQLEMFGVFIRNSGMLDALRNKDWATFARKYNGPSYAKRGYHTRMAKEYAHYKNPGASDKTSVEPSAQAPARKQTATRHKKKRKRTRK